MTMRAMRAVAPEFNGQGQETTQWYKSSYSMANGCCVEVACGSAVVAVRDSKHPDGFVMRIRPATWSSFVTAVKAGTFDLPDCRS